MPCESHAAHGQRPSTRCSACTFSSPGVSLLQSSCRIKHSTRVCGGGGREVRIRLADGLSQSKLPSVLRETLLVTASAFVVCQSLRHLTWLGTPSFQTVGTESRGAVCRWVSLHLPWPFPLADYFKTVPSQQQLKLALTNGFLFALVKWVCKWQVRQECA